MLFYYDKITVVACGKYLSLDYCPISVAFVILKPKICILSVICGYNRILTRLLSFPLQNPDSSTSLGRQ